MEQNIKDLLAKIPPDKGTLTQAFLRQNKANLPNAIVNYIIVYAFFWINEWFKGGLGWIIDETRLIARKGVDAPKGTVYANPEISQGKYEWKIKLNQGQFQGWRHRIYIGIASSTDCLESYHYGSASVAAQKGETSYSWLNEGYIMNHAMGGSIPWKEGLANQNTDDNPFESDIVVFDKGDTLTVHLDLDNGTIGFSKNDEFVGIAFDNVDTTKSYRLKISPNNAVSKYEFELLN